MGKVEVIHTTKMNATFPLQQSCFICPTNKVDEQQLVFWIPSCGSPQTSQRGKCSLQLEVFSPLKHHYSCIDLCTSPFKLWKPPVCFWKCINHATKSKRFTPPRKLFASSNTTHSTFRLPGCQNKYLSVSFTELFSFFSSNLFLPIQFERDYIQWQHSPGYYGLP